MKYRYPLLVLFLLLCRSAAGQDLSLMWLHADEEAADVHAAFRGAFTLEDEQEIELRLCGASYFIVHLDGEYFYEGPDRFTATHPEYRSKTAKLGKGEHTVAVHVHYEGVQTRIMDNIAPFLMCGIYGKDGEIEAGWKCSRLPGYDSAGFRVSGLYGWAEWSDSRQMIHEWHAGGYDDSSWSVPVRVERDLGTLAESSIAEVRNTENTPALIAEGMLAEMYGYERDNPSARFFLRDLQCDDIRPQGVWRRYDAGRIQLLRPGVTLDVPEGTVVEIAYSESLIGSRVSPWISLSMSDSHHLDHFVARGGEQLFAPMKFKGARFFEVHVLAPAEHVRFVDARITSRSYYGEPEGRFDCPDALLNLIWKTGVDTYRSCAEDALTDTPVRERGLWLGDACIGIRTGSVAYQDISIIRRALLQFALCARDDGMVAALCPGTTDYLSTYSAQWVGACIDYWRHTGDQSVLKELFSYSEANADAFGGYISEDGISPAAGWGFIDWGYVPNDGPTDMGVNMHVYKAFTDMVKWCSALGKDAAGYEVPASQLRDIVTRYFEANRLEDGYNWTSVGYHRTVLGLSLGFIDGEHTAGAIEFIKSHIMNCFPNDPTAPVLSDPGANNPRLITPYFAHQAFPVLIEYGEMDFVLDQFRSCWGWILERGITTWTEVFDTRWSHCHQWSGCPTWQLSRYVLGLHARFDMGDNHFLLDLHAGSLPSASGTLPLPCGGKVYVDWTSDGKEINYMLKSEVPLIVEIVNRNGGRNRRVKVNGELNIKI